MAHGLTSTMPPPPAKLDDKLTPEMRQWLSRGWQAKCCYCSHSWTSHQRPGDATCPRCAQIPTLATQMAAISSIPQPETDRYNARQRRLAEDAVHSKLRASIKGAKS